MASVKDKLIIGIDLDEKEVNKDFKKIERQSKKTSKKIGKNFKNATAALGKAFTGVGAKVAAVGIAFAAAFGAKKVIAAAIQQEDAINRLNSALQITGKFSKETSNELQTFASGLQQVTKFGDEAILEAQALIQTLGNLSKNTLKDATTATLDLAAALKIDLQTAAILVGKAAAGEVGSFSRYGLIIKKAKTETETFSRALTAIQKKFGGAAKKELGTFGAATQQLSNTFGDLTEEIGFLITKNPVVLKAIENLNLVFKEMGDNVKDGRKEFIKLVNVGIVRLLIGLREAKIKFEEFVKVVKEFDTGPILKVIEKMNSIGRALGLIGKLASTIDLKTALLIPLVGVVPTLQAAAGAAVTLSGALDDVPKLSFGKKINNVKKDIELLREKLEQTRRANSRAFFFKTDVSPILQDIKLMEEKLSSLRMKRKESLAGTKTDNENIKKDNEDFLAEMIALFQSPFTDDGEEKKTFADGVDIDPDKKAAIKDNYADLFGFLRLRFDSTAKSMKKTGATLAAQFKSGLVKGISGGIQSIVNNIMAGENAFANFGKFVLGVLADMATQFGMTLIGAGIGVEALKSLGGAAAIAAGIGLVALGAVMKNLAGGGETATASSFTGGGAESGAVVQDEDIAQVSEEEERQARTIINANFLGPILDRKESALAIIDILQEGFDEEGVEVIRGIGA